MKTLQFCARIARLETTITESGYAMRVVRDFMAGVISVLTVTPAPLYRYPYRNSAEAFRGDWGRIGKDIAFLFDQVKREERPNDAP